MSGRREVDSVAARYVLRGLGRAAVVQLLAGIALLMLGNLAFGAMVDEIGATRRAARGDGVQGLFTAESRTCSRAGCFWYGSFRSGGGRPVTIDRVRLRGGGDRSVSAGDAVPALDVGSPDFVHRAGASPDWSEAVGVGFVAALTGGLGAGSTGRVLWGVRRTRPPRSSRRRAARSRGRSAMRDLAGRDRWGWTARPGRSVVRVKVARSWGRTVAAVVVLVPLGAATPSLLAGWWTRLEGTTVIETIAGSWWPVVLAVTATVAIQTLRLALMRPRMWVTEEEVVIWDGLLLWKALRIPRTGLAAVRCPEPGRRHEEEAARLTPFGEETNLVLRTRDAVRLPARRLRWGNWFWVMLSSRGHGPGPTIPQRGRPVRSLELRVREPRRTVADLDRWLGEKEETARPRPASDDHAYHGRLRTYRGTGSRRLRIKGRLPQPVIAEFAGEGPGTLRASLRRTEFGRGTPLVSCGPGARAAATVLDDRWVADAELTSRFVHVEAEGPWTVTVGGPERSRSFGRSTTGHGPEVLRYEGSPGVAVLTCPDGGFHEIHLRGPDLSSLYGRGSVAAAGMPGAEVSSAPSRSTFAVPTGAVLQIGADDTEWRIDVTPLEQADVSSVEDAGSVPPAGHVRPFEGFITGDHAAVVRYLGPPGRVLFHGGGGFGLVRLSTALAPVRTLVLPGREQVLDLRSHTLLQVAGGSGAWSMEEAPAAGAGTGRQPRS
ncbi:hypothetical protein ACQEU6_39365 [Spirillospora sp. CA-108201]